MSGFGEIGRAGVRRTWRDGSSRSVAVAAREFCSGDRRALRDAAFFGKPCVCRCAT